MHFHQLCDLGEEHTRDLRLEANHHRLLRAATPSLRKKFAEALRILAAKLEAVGDAPLDTQPFDRDEGGHGAGRINFERNRYMLNKH